MAHAQTNSDYSDDLFTRLSTVSEFSVTAVSVDSWQARGEGKVEVLKSGQSSVTWHENGVWDKTFRELEFSNVYCWTRVSLTEIKLSHLRYGADKPVQLITIHYQANGQWKAAQPHVCGEDKYKLDLNVDNDCLILNWRIEGPGKNQNSIIYYR